MARMNPKDATNSDYDIQNVKYKAVFLSTEECETLAFCHRLCADAFPKKNRTLWETINIAYIFYMHPYSVEIHREFLA